jgi:Raf kinase inhibitor-like YbhB/YbcL family protein
MREYAGGEDCDRQRRITVRLTSSAYDDGGTIPARHTCDGENVSPPLALRDLPPGTASLVILMDDPDAPAGLWVHWLAYDLEPVTELPEGASGPGVTGPGVAGLNTWGQTGYRGPCPPRGTHRYVLHAWALDATLGLAPGADRAAVEAAMAGHVLGQAELMGRYERAGPS